MSDDSVAAFTVHREFLRDGGFRGLPVNPQNGCAVQAAEFFSSRDVCVAKP